MGQIVVTRVRGYGKPVVTAGLIGGPCPEFVTPGEIGVRERSQKAVTYQLRFICQPNPTVTIA